MKRFIIVGLGIFGSGTAETLYEMGNEVIAVDLKDELVDRIAPHVTRAAVADGRHADVLERIGARDADAGVVSTGSDISASVLAVMALRDLDVGEIYVKVISRDHARVMRKIGVTETIFPERESSINLATRISRSNALLNYVRLGSGFSMQEMAVPNKWIGKTLRELQLRPHYKVSVIAVHDIMLDQMIPVPDPDAPLKDSDTLLLAGTNESLARVSRID
jgi:trk system potassium uptake protein TrkA